MKTNKLYLGLSSLLGTASLLGIASLPTRVSATTEVVDPVSIEVPVACSMGGAGQNSHTATLMNGTYSAASGSAYENGIGSTTLTVFCNDANGFSIYAVGYTGDTTSGGNNNKLVGASTGLTINTGVYTSGDTSSSWSMKVNKVNDATAYNPANMTITNSYDNWHTVPTAYTQVAQYKANTGSSATDTTLGGKVTTTYAAYISTTQAADTYTGKVKYTMVHPYNAAAPVDTLVMQDVAAWKNTLAVGQEVDAIDARDGKTYKVAKLADGNIWMTQNLDLDLDSTKTYTPQDTDISANWTPALSTYSTGDGAWDDSLTTPESYDPGDIYWSGTIGEDTPVSSGDIHYHLGNYYNWTAAVAMNDSSSYVVPGASADQSICPAGWTLPKATLTDYAYDYESSDLGNLWSEYGWSIANDYNFNSADQSYSSPLYFAFSGHYVGGGNNYSSIGEYGEFWLPMADDDYYAFHARFDSYGSATCGIEERRIGRSVRCLARQ